MSNQRAAKTYRAAAASDSRVEMRQVIDLMQRCANVLERSGDENSSFYFEQVMEFIKDNPSKAFTEDAGRILGV
jgi:GH25 family lysozyme M1 (1,4-beta-N-acetylmuramidase)